MIQQEPEKEVANQADSDVTEAEDIETLKKFLAEEKAKTEANLVNWQRAQADFVNYKRRSEQEREEISKFANATLMINLLPVLDDLERAFTSIPPRIAKLSWMDGLRLIERKFQASLETLGLFPIKALGEPFDPTLHEAAMHGKGKEGIVIKELQKGYKLHDKIIRPAMVVVGNGEEKEKKEEA